MRCRPAWVPEIVGLTLCAAAATLLFGLTDLDMRVSGLFHHPGAPGGGWPEGQRLLPRALDRSVPWLAGLLLSLGLAELLAGTIRARWRAWRRSGLLILLVFVLGPGLVVNLVFKDHWRRPRPHQTAGLGGDHQYVAPPRLGPHGKSFPCGHASVAFAYGVFFYVLRRRPAAAWGALAGSTALGLLIGLERVASGAHFLSDVIWAGILTWGTAALVHHLVLRGTPAAERAEVADGAVPARRSRAAPAILVAAGAALAILAVVLAMPFEQSIARTFPNEPGGLVAAPWRIRLSIAAGSARVVFLPAAPALLVVSGEFNGYGVPGLRIEDRFQADPSTREVAYMLRPRGLPSVLSGRTRIEVASPAAASIAIDVPDGVLTLEAPEDAGPLPPITCRIRPDALRLRGLRRDQVRVEPP